MEHQVSRKYYVDLQVKVRMSLGTDRPLAFMTTVTSFFFLSRKFIDQLTDDQLHEWHSDPVHLLLTYFVCS